MKKIMKLFTIFALSLLSQSCFATDDCNPEFDAFCGGRGAYPTGDKTVKAFIGAGLLVGATIGLYFILRNDTEGEETSVRIMADYHNGKGLRLTSYENIFNVSLFTPRANIVSEPLSNLSEQFTVKENTYNLVHLSLHWE
ncbi:MAG: hypothetical protein ACI808_001356 [Paraglaciecola sp.]|jgi:hypothetical protein